MAVRARSPRGRHFLRASALAADIVRSAGVGPEDLVLDLGAGGGALTRPLARAAREVVAVELDTELARALRGRFANVRVVHGDARAVPLPREPFLVVANLPFDCGTALLRRLLDPRVPLVRAVVVVEWALGAKRAAVWPSTRLGVEWSAWHELDLLRRLPRSCFAPPPAVDAALLGIVRRREPLVPVSRAGDYRRFLARGFRLGLRSVVPPRRLKRLADELGFDRAALPRDLDARQWSLVYARVRGPSG